MEMLQVADAVAREKNIDRDIVLSAMEEAIQKAGRSKYGHDHDIRAHIDRKNGLISLKRYREVVEQIVDPEARDWADFKKAAMPFVKGSTPITCACGCVSMIPIKCSPLPKPISRMACVTGVLNQS